jgi:Xaa-Pro aminopeptidase/Xaa-Pro dipeptidase
MPETLLEKLRARMQERDLDAVWVSRAEHVRYLSGFTSPRDGRVLVTLETEMLYTDARYTVQAEQESSLPHHITHTPGAMGRLNEMIEHAAALVAGKAVGFEADDLPYGWYARFFDKWKAKLVPVYDLLEPMRAVKSANELEKIRTAARIADEALVAIEGLIEPGRSEREVALQLEVEMRSRGAEAAGFEFIVAGGERGAMPHGAASERKLELGDLVTVDCGALYHGYHSDITRAFAVGELSHDMKHIHRVTREAQEAALGTIKSGAKCVDVDAAARSVIERAGFGEAFVHGLGHGVGLAIHELPTLSKAAGEALLEAGMVVTVEPGIYLPGRGGVRLEDLVLVTDSGFEFLSKAPKQAIS